VTYLLDVNVLIALIDPTHIALEAFDILACCSDEPLLRY
jgi:hypothetical protein